MALTSNNTPPVTKRDSWHETFLHLRGMQEDHGWDDFLMPTSKALWALDELSKTQFPFTVLNGLTGNESMWLWLSPDAIGFLQERAPQVFDSMTTIQRRIYLSNGTESPVRESLHCFLMDAEASVANMRRRQRLERERQAA